MFVKKVFTWIKEKSSL